MKSYWSRLLEIVFFFFSGLSRILLFFSSWSSPTFCFSFLRAAYLYATLYAAEDKHHSSRCNQIDLHEFPCLLEITSGHWQLPCFPVKVYLSRNVLHSCTLRMLDIMSWALVSSFTEPQIAPISKPPTPHNYLRKICQSHTHPIDTVLACSSTYTANQTS